MAKRIRGPRLTLGEFKALLSVHAKLAAVDKMLAGTNWAGAQACRILAGEVDIFVADLYNKAERAFLPNPPGGPSDQGTQDPAADTLLTVEAAGSATQPGQPEPDKLQRCIHGLLADQHCGLCQLGNNAPQN